MPLVSLYLETDERKRKEEGKRGFLNGAEVGESVGGEEPFSLGVDSLSRFAGTLKLEVSLSGGWKNLGD